MSLHNCNSLNLLKGNNNDDDDGEWMRENEKEKLLFIIELA